jgi:opacity protein-like surface antigen
MVREREGTARQPRRLKAIQSVTERIGLDFGIRYSDLGDMRTASGPALIARGSKSRVIAIDATHAKLRATSFILDLRYRF